MRQTNEVVHELAKTVTFFLTYASPMKSRHVLLIYF